jgi:hypothetical protein
VVWCGCKAELHRLHSSLFTQRLARRMQCRSTFSQCPALARFTRRRDFLRLFDLTNVLANADGITSSTRALCVLEDATGPSLPELGFSSLSSPDMKHIDRTPSDDVISQHSANALRDYIRVVMSRKLTSSPRCPSRPGRRAVRRTHHQRNSALRSRHGALCGSGYSHDLPRAANRAPSWPCAPSGRLRRAESEGANETAIRAWRPAPRRGVAARK